MDTELSHDLLIYAIGFITAGSTYKALCLVSTAMKSAASRAHLTADIKFANHLLTIFKLRPDVKKYYGACDKTNPNIPYMCLKVICPNVNQFRGVYRNPASSWEDILGNMNQCPPLLNEWVSISAHPCVTEEILKTNPDFPWSSIGIMSNGNMSLETVDKWATNGQLDRYNYFNIALMTGFFKHPEATEETIFKYPVTTPSWAIATHPNISRKFLHNKYGNPLPFDVERGWAQNPKFQLTDVYPGSLTSIIVQWPQLMRVISKHPNITWEIIQANPDLPWSWHNMMVNPNITWEIIQANPDRPWKISEFCGNPNFTWKIFRDNIQIAWNLQVLCCNDFGWNQRNKK